MKRLAYIIMCFSFLSCTSHHIGKYVYLEIWNAGTRLHVNRNCKNYSKAHMVQYIDTADIVKLPIVSYCPKCVSEEDAITIEQFIKSEQKINALYDQLKSEGYELDDIETFKEGLRNSEEFRRQIYDAQKADGYDMGGDFNAWNGRVIQSFNK